jgi:hypothetical protein
VDTHANPVGFLTLWLLTTALLRGCGVLTYAILLCRLAGALPLLVSFLFKRARPIAALIAQTSWLVERRNTGVRAISCKGERCGIVSPYKIKQARRRRSLPR